MKKVNFTLSLVLICVLFTQGYSQTQNLARSNPPRFYWALNENDQIFYRGSPQESWTKLLDGSRLRKITVGLDGRIWGVNRNEDIYTKNGVNGNWQLIPGKLIDISVQPNGQVLGINSLGNVFKRNGVAGSWQLVNSRFVKADNPYIQNVQQYFWALNPKGQIFYSTIFDSTWRKINGGLTILSKGSDGRIWGVNRNGDIFSRDGVNGNWQLIPGKLTDISVQPNGQVLGINSAGNVFKRLTVADDWQYIGNTGFSKYENPFVQTIA